MNRLNHFILIGSLVTAFGTYAQNVGINTTGAVPNTSAGLDVDFSNKGLLVPRVALTGTSSNAPIGAGIATSLLVYNTATTADVTPGYYYWGGSNWIRFSGDGDAWRTTGNAGTNTTSNFIGTTDNVGLRVRTNNANRFEFTNNGRLRAYDNGTAAQPTYSWNGASGQTMGMYRIGANILGFSTSSEERIRIDQNGSVGIGTTTPSTSLIGGSNVARLNVVAGTTPANSAMSEFINTSNSGLALWAHNTSTTNGWAAMEAATNGTGTGLTGIHLATTGAGVGVSGASNSANGFGMTATNSGGGTALRSIGGLTGSTNFATTPNNNSIGVSGVYSGGGNFDGTGVLGQSTPAAGWGIGVTGIGNWLSVFSIGDFAATGGKFFLIDHPSDPENKILRHANIESNEILNHYRGNVILDANGSARVQLPDYFEDININFSYTLTAVGLPAPNIHISQEVQNNEFVISGGEPNQKVSWAVQAERNDAYMQANPDRRNMEIEKKEYMKGKYFDPASWNQPEEKGLFALPKEAMPEIPTEITPKSGREK